MTHHAICNWDFTLKEEGVCLVSFKNFLKAHCKKWVFQLEQGESGYKHYQGRISLKRKNRKGPHYENIHWSPTSTANADNDFYVVKDDTRISGPWTDKDITIPRQVAEITQLRPWQQQVLDSAKDWNPRTINYLYCPNGNIGKSTLGLYALCHGLGRMIPPMESFKDYMRMVMDAPKAPLYIIDLPRATTKGSCMGFWSAIESIKNGWVYDDRYNFKEEVFTSPAVWVFANHLPDEDLLSKDRWVYWEVVEDQLCRYKRRPKACNNNFVATGTTGTNEFDAALEQMEMDWKQGRYRRGGSIEDLF